MMFSFVNGAENLIKLLKENKYPEKKEILIDKVFFYDTMFFDILLTTPARRDKARTEAIKLLDFMDSLMTSGDDFALGTPDYTLADIIATAFLNRLNI